MSASSSTLRRIISGTGVYSIAIIAGRLNSILLLPIYTRYLSATEYGTLELFELTLYVLSALIGLKIADVITYHYSNAEQFGVKPDVVLSTAFLCSFLLGIALTLVGCLLAPLLMNLVVGDTSVTYLFQIMVVSYSLGLSTEVALAYLRVIDSARVSVAFSIGRMVVAAIVNIYFLVVLRMGMAGMVWGSLISSTIMMAGLVAVCGRRQYFRFSLKLLWRMIRYGAPLGIGGIGILIIHYGDRAFLRQYVGLADIGVYSLAYKLGMLISYIQLPFDMYWRSQMYKIMAQPDGEKTYIRVATYLTVCVAYCCLGLASLAAPVLTLAVGLEFRPAATYVGWIALAYAIRTVGTHFCSIFLIEGKTFLESLVVWISGLACLAAYAVLIPRYQIWGAIIATNIAFAIMLSAAYILGQMVRPFAFEIRRILQCIVVTSLLVLAHSQMPAESFVLQLRSALIVTLGFPLLLWITGFIREDERAFIQRQFSVVTGNLGSRCPPLQAPILEHDTDLGQEPIVATTDRGSSKSADPPLMSSPNSSTRVLSPECHHTSRIGETYASVSPDVSDNNSMKSLIVICGAPRSGTSWLGKLFDSHPRTLYRHEPDSEIRPDGLPMVIGDEYECYAEQLRAYVRNLPNIRNLKVSGSWPVFDKAYMSGPRQLMHKGAILVAKSLGVASLCDRIPDYCLPRDSDEFVVTWKTIDSMGRLGLLSNVLAKKRIICIVRHPAGVIGSILRGRHLNKFRKNDRQAEDYSLFSMWLDGGWGDKYGLTLARMQAMDEIERLAWCNIMQLEKATHDLNGRADCRIVCYEDLCARPREVVRELFDLCQLESNAQSERFLHNSTSTKSRQYYSVYKNPLESASKWMTELDRESQQKINAVLEQSEFREMWTTAGV